MKRKRKVWSMVFKILLLAVLTVGIWYCVGLQKERTSKYQLQDQNSFNAELRPLTLRQRELELQLQNLEREYSRIIVGTSTCQILAVSPGKWVEQNLYPLMKDAELCGVIAMNLDNAPGGEDMLSDLTVCKLRDEGWQLIYSFDSNDFQTRTKNITKELKDWSNQNLWKTGKEPTDKEKQIKKQELMGDALSEWKKEVDVALYEMGIELDATIYFPSGEYKRDYDSMLRAAGFDMVIHHGEEDRIIYTDLSENRIWFPGAIPWGRSDLEKILNNVASDGTNVVLTVSAPGDNVRDQFVSESFASMLRLLLTMKEEQGMEICTLKQMPALQMNTVVEVSVKENQRQKQAAQDELDALEIQINELYEKYGMH